MHSGHHVVHLRRLLCVAAATAILAISEAATAQTYPSRPVRIFVPFPSGSSPEIVTRILAKKLAEQLGQHVIVEARPGGSGVIAAEIVKRAPPDGYTLLLVGPTLLAVLPALKSKLPYDADKDFVTLSRVASVANVLAVHASLEIGTVRDLVNLAKIRSGQLNFGSSGNGTLSHLAGEMFNVLAGVKTVHVPYKGTPAALNDLVAGQLQFIIAAPPSVMLHARAGRIKVIATTGANRDPLLPELPVMAETIPGFESTLWWGIALPAKPPEVVVTRLQAEIEALRTPEVRELLAKQGATPNAESAAQFTTFIRAERARLARIGHQVGITLE